MSSNVSAIQAEVNKRWPGAMKMASDEEFKITRLPTGILSIDYMMNGGFARGRHTELFGGYSVGKTYLTYRLIAQTQQDGGTAAFVDCEGSFDPEFAKSAGVDLKKLVLHKQEHGHQVIDFLETLLRSREFDVQVLDSIAALLPKQEYEGEMSGASMGTQQAKLMSAGLRRLTAANKDTAMVYINQTRENVGTMFGKRSITSGGKAMAFYAGTRLELNRIENIKKKAKLIDHKTGKEKQGDVVTGHRVMFRVEKDKTGSARTGAEGTFVFDYEQGGIDHIEDLMYLGRVTGLVHVSGNSWWVEDYEDEKQNGRPKFYKWLKKNRAVADELTELIMEHRAEIDSEEDED